MYDEAAVPHLLNIGLASGGHTPNLDLDWNADIIVYLVACRHRTQRGVAMLPWLDESGDFIRSRTPLAPVVESTSRYMLHSPRCVLRPLSPGSVLECAHAGPSQTVYATQPAADEG